MKASLFPPVRSPGHLRISHGSDTAAICASSHLMRERALVGKPGRSRQPPGIIFASPGFKTAVGVPCCFTRPRIIQGNPG
ncbi:hypothetical protein RRG08_011828 [Elysia crispata]|uniref:Uncharacterized protein n=1 Tax=Elysia crispata TaxID=231223 RepID=A0AAE1DHR1_9GAST|nr:hypothetical protein RRG08_011828 [Elysia crispata]